MLEVWGLNVINVTMYCEAMIISLCVHDLDDVVAIVQIKKRYRLFFLANKMIQRSKGNNTELA